MRLILKAASARRFRQEEKQRTTKKEAHSWRRVTPRPNAFRKLSTSNQNKTFGVVSKHETVDWTYSLAGGNFDSDRWLHQ